nr:hypothetical protein [Tanacetum cinerariifolium]
MSGEEPAPQMAPAESPQMVSSVKLPILKQREYTLWSMRMEQYLTNTDYGLWQVIMNGDEPVQTTRDENGVETEVPPKTAHAILARQRERKAKSILLLAILDEYQLSFHSIKDAKSLWVAIKSRFGGNVESKKMQETVLKQQFESFSVSDTEGLDKAYDRFQKLIGLLEVHEDTNSINEVNTANGVSTAAGHSSSGQASSSSYTDDLMFSVFASQSNSPQLDDEDLEQIDHDDLEEMDLKWQVVMLSMRVKECRAPRNQENRNGDARYRNRDNNKRTLPVESSDALVVQDNALIVQDGLGYDWSYIAQEEPTEFVLMAYTSRSDTEKNKVTYEEKIAVLEFEVKDKGNAITRLTNQLDQTLKKKEDLKAKLEQFEISSKNLNKQINSQLIAKDKTGLGYGDQLSESDSEVLPSVFDSRSSDGDDNPTKECFVAFGGSTKGGKITKYIAASHCCGQVLWIQNQMMNYGYNFMQTKIHVDNESAICVIKNPVYHSKTNHIEIRHHFIRDSYEKRLIEMVKIHTDNNVVDLLTKAFDVSRFNFLVASIVKNGLKKHVSSDCKDRHLGKVKKGQDTKVVVSGAKIPYWGFSNMKRAFKEYSKEITSLFDTMLVHHRHGEPSTPESSPSKITSSPSLSPQHTSINAPSTSQSPNIQNTPVTEETTLMPHDSPLQSVHSLGRDEGSLSLNELTVLCTSLSTKVQSLENELQQTKKVYTSALTKLILRVKKLERIVNTSKARRKARIVISEDEDAEDPSKQRRSLIEELDMDVDISLVPPHAADQGRKTDDTQVSGQPDDQLGVFSAAKVLVDAAEQGRSVGNVQTYTRQRTRLNTSSTLVSTASEMVNTVGLKARDKAQKLHEEELARFNAEQESIDIARKEKVIDEEVERQSTEEEKGKKSDDSSKPTRKKTLARKRAGGNDSKKSVRKQKLEDDTEKKELKAYLDIVSEDEFVMEVESLATKYPIINWKTHVLTEHFMYYQIIKPDGSSKNYKIFSEMLDDFDRHDVMDLHRLVEERYTTSPEGYDLMLWGDLKTLFEHDEDMNSERINMNTI